MTPKAETVSAHVYEARDLIDMALQGHYLFNDVILETVWRLFGRYGDAARARMYALPDVAAYATREEIEAWGRYLYEVELEFERLRASVVAEPDRDQLKFPWS